MMRRIIESSLRLRLLVVAIAAVVMAVGLAELRDMPVDVLPEFAPPYVEPWDFRRRRWRSSSR
jgi:Cu/Ag efflux pump CusA